VLGIASPYISIAAFFPMDTDSTSAEPAPAAENSLGLDLQGLNVQDTLTPTEDIAPAVSSDDPPNDFVPAVPDESVKQATDDNGDNAPKKEKKKPYLNSDRYLTGSNPRDKPSDEELADRITRIREQNEKIKLRRLVHKSRCLFFCSTSLTDPRNPGCSGGHGRV
jgi:hypothetical protein